MSGVVSVGAALATTAIAASAVASVGLTVGSAFAIMGAVGATLGAVGAVTKIKELQYAGAAIGAVGMIGGLASAAGMFGEAGALFGGGGEIFSAGAQVAGGAGEAAQAASAAADVGGLWAGASAVPVGGATMGYDASIFTPGVSGDGLADAINMVNGVPEVATGATEVATAAAPDVAPAPAEQVLSDTTTLPGYESPTKGFGLAETTPAQGVEPPPGTMASDVSGQVSDPAKSLLNGQVPEGYGLNDQGQLAQIPQGGGPAGEQVPGSLGAGATNQAAPGMGYNEPLSVNGVGAPQSSGIVGETGLIGTGAPSGPYSATLATDAAVPKMSLINGTTKVPSTPLEGPSAWSGIFDFIQKNQTLSYGAMQTIGSFINGVTKPGADPAVLAALQSRMAANQATKNLYDQQAALLQQRAARANEPMPVAVRPQGLINGGGLPAVTGRV